MENELKIKCQQLVDWYHAKASTNPPKTLGQIIEEIEEELKKIEAEGRTAT